MCADQNTNMRKKMKIFLLKFHLELFFLKNFNNQHKNSIIVGFSSI